MTVTINIHIDPLTGGDPRTQLEDHMRALGFIRKEPSAREIVEESIEQMGLDLHIEPNGDVVSNTPNTPAPKRERGQPSPGKARRTKAEIAEDELYANSAPGIASGEAGVSSEPVTAEQVKADLADTVAAISTGEERVGPEDDPADAVQDAADEAAETAAAKTDDKLTIEDVRNVIGLYVKAYGLAAAQEDGPKILSSVVPGAAKASDIPEDKIADVIAAVKAAGKANTYNRTTVAA